MPPKTTSLKQWSQRLSQYAQLPAVQGELDYWSSLGKGRFAPLPVDHRRGGNTFGSAETVAVFLDAEKTRALLQDVPKAYNTQINDLLLAALAQSFSEWTSQSSLLIDLEGHGREAILEGVDVSRTVGWFTTMYPVGLELGLEAGAAEAITSIKEQLRAIPNHGMNYGVLRYLSRDPRTARQWERLTRPEAVFLYLGRFDQGLSETSLFAPALESAGPEVCPAAKRQHLLEITGAIVEGRFELSLRYSRDLHRRETIEALAGGYVESLESLIAHCLSPEAGGRTVSDFPLAGLDARKLSKLSALIEKADRSQEASS